jgi:hypothetical protein
MNLNEMCALLGFEIEVRRVLKPDSDDIYEGDEMVYVAEATIRTNGWGNAFTARTMLYQHLERLITDIIRANRGLSNEDLARIAVGKVLKTGVEK